MANTTAHRGTVIRFKCLYNFRPTVAGSNLRGLRLRIVVHLIQFFQVDERTTVNAGEAAICVVASTLECEALVVLMKRGDDRGYFFGRAWNQDACGLERAACRRPTGGEAQYERPESTVGNTKRWVELS